MKDVAGTSSKALADKRQLFELTLKKKGFIKKPGTTTTITRRPASTTPECQLSYAQQRLWLLDQLNPGGSSYNMASALRLTGDLDVPAMRRTLNEVVRRHEVLRTSFSSRDGSPFQLIHPSLHLDLPVADLSALDEHQREPAARALAQAEATQPFDLARGPLLRARLLRLSEREHVALFTMHHIISDGWSLGVLVREVAALYEAFSRGDASPLEELPVQYADYAVWQREYLSGEVLEKQLEYWRRQLAGAPPMLNLPTDRPRPSVQRHVGGRVAMRLGRNLAESLKAMTRAEGATLFMTLLAAWQALLHRYSGEELISIGTPVAGRRLPETEGLIGLFLNTLVLRTDVSGDPSFRELLAQVREVCLGAYAHQDVPFERLIEELQPERSLSHSPLFQVMFNLLNQSDETIKLEGLSIQGLTSDHHDSKFDLTLYASEREEGIQLTLNYNLDLFEETTARGILSHLSTLLEGAVADPEQRLSTLPLLSPDERRRLSTQSNLVKPIQPFVAFEKHEIEQSIPACFARRTRDHQESTSVETNTCRWTYKELDDIAGRIARSLVAGSSSADERVALLFEHDAPLVAGIMGALKAGRTYVPLDPLYPPERITYILEDSQSSAILTNNKCFSLAEKLSGGTRRLVNIDDLDIASPDDGAAFPDVSPDAVAYILYTSGSTGRPKGVMQTHRGVLHHIRNYTNNLHINAHDRLTLLSSYSFDAAVMDIFGALLNGAVLCPFDVRENGFEGLPGWLAARRVTIYHSTPTVYRYFIGDLTGEESFQDIRLVVLGGEEVFKSDVEMYRKCFEPGCIFVNGLGPTESTVTLQYFIGHETGVVGNNVPVGYAVEDTEVLLLNEEGQQVEGFGVGEIAIKSAYLATGYWQQPELTRAVFLPDSNDGGERIYRTGDVGRRLADGSLLFVGRRDRQVKIRGHRVELGEIEAVLSMHPDVGEAAVIVRDDEGERRLEAYYVAKLSPAPEVAELRHHLKERLPSYMVPSAFVRLDHLPLTPNGKLDRRALPASGFEASVAAYTAPHTEEQPALLSEAERRQVLVQWNETEAAYPSGKCLHELFESQVSRTPGAVAVACEGQQLTYEELNDRANMLAHYLQRLGAGPDVAVGVLMQRSIEVIVAMLGVLKAGAAYVPLDAEYPEARLRHMVEAASLSVVVTMQELSPLLPPQVRPVCLDTDRTAIGEHSSQSPSSAVTDANAAYVIYTSGSTGKPKGVLVEHRQLVNYLYSITEKLEMEPGSAFALVSSFAADLGHTVIFPALCGGGALHVITRERAMDASALGSYFLRHGIDYLKIVPSHLAALLASGVDGAGVLPRRCLVLGGEASSYALVERIKTLNERCRILNHYGPTETTVGVLTYRIENMERDRPEATVPLGRPLSNVQAYILDGQMEPVPVGVAGELYIGGRCVARGYVGHPELTSQRFIPHPFSAEPGARLYRTGDRARHLPDGDIEFLGRFDHQIKLRGFRIEPGEIESAIMDYPEITETAVVFDDRDGRQRLIAYVVSPQQPQLDLRELSQYLRQRLPDYLVPSSFVRMQRLPLTPNGKVDRRALLALDLEHRATGTPFVPPQTAAEQVVTGIFRQVLGVGQVGVTDNFFELGGHSLLATRAVSRVVKVFQVSVGLRHLFERPTVTGVIETLSEAWGGREVVEEIAQTFIKVGDMSGGDIETMLAQLKESV